MVLPGYDIFSPQIMPRNLGKLPKNIGPYPRFLEIAPMSANYHYCFMYLVLRDTRYEGDLKSVGDLKTKTTSQLKITPEKKAI